MPRALKSVLFDLDGTLIDSIGLLLASMRHAFEGFEGEHPTEQDWIAGIGTPLAKQLRVYAPLDAEFEALRTRYRDFQREHHDAFVRVFPGTLETIAALEARGLSLALVTSKGNAFARRSLEYTGLSRSISVVIGADTVTRHKPEPEPVLAALEQLGAKPGEAVFIGDSPHDVASGNAAGVVTIAALWGPFTREQLAAQAPVHWLGDIRELPALIDSM